MPPCKFALYDELGLNKPPVFRPQPTREEAINQSINQTFEAPLPAQVVLSQRQELLAAFTQMVTLIGLMVCPCAQLFLLLQFVYYLTPPLPPPRALANIANKIRVASRLDVLYRNEVRARGRRLLVVKRTRICACKSTSD
jgi:hypothetical protein